jgi:acylphosphatase
MPAKRVTCVVRGRVQGVYFRASTEREAKRLGLAGWVRNLESGEVELCAEGDEARLNELVAWAHRGPPAASVEAVESRWSEATGEFARFEVR